MESLYKLKNGSLERPPSYRLNEDGTTIINFESAAGEYGYKKLIVEKPPTYNSEFQDLNPLYEEFDDYILNKWELIEVKTLEKVMEERIEKLSKLCNETILGGFNSLGYYFTFDMKDQINFTQQLLMMDKTAPVEWKTEDQGVKIFTGEEFLQIISDAQQHKTSNIKKYWGLKNQILGSTTHEEVLQVTWE
jgi:hypothetical protein